MKDVLEFIFFFGVGWLVAGQTKKTKGCSGNCQQGRKDCDCF